MRRSVVLLLTATAAVGSVIPSAASSPRLGLTIAPVRLFVDGTNRIGPVMIYNAGEKRETITVSASDSWLTPSATDFTLAPGDRQLVYAEPRLPAIKDAGEHVSQLQFSTELVGSGSLRSTLAVAADVVFGPYGHVVSDLRVLGLSAPWLADSFDAPVINLTVDNSRSNIHRRVKVAPFGEVLLQRGQRRTLSLAWTRHPFIGLGSITVPGQSLTTLFLPWHAALGFLLSLVGLVTLVRLVRRRRSR